MNFVRLLPAALIALCLLPRHVMAQVAVPTFDPSRAAANALRSDAAAQPLLIDQQAKTGSALAAENPFAPTSPGDSDIGQQSILQRQEKAKEFAVMLDSAYFFTDNAAQVHDGAREDWFYVGGVTLAWQPRINKRFYADFSVAQHWYVYNESSELNYQSGEAAAGIIVVMPEIWDTVWQLQYYYQRITQGLDNSPVYDTQNLRIGVQKTVPLGSKNSLNLGLLASLVLDASPEELQRNEYSGTVAWNCNLTQTVLLSLSYRLLYYDYFNLDGRQDWDHNFGVALVWHPKDWLEFAGSWNYTINQSNKEIFSYDAQIAGPSVSVRMKF